MPMLPYTYAPRRNTTSSNFTHRHVYNSLTPILYSRFILNLRQVDQPSLISTQDMHLNRLSSMPSFAIPESRIIGNLGEDLRGFATDEGKDGEGTVEESSQDESKRLSQAGEGSDINMGPTLQRQVQNEMVSIFREGRNIS